MDWQTVWQSLSSPTDSLALILLSLGVALAVLLRAVARIWQKVRPVSAIWGAPLVRLASWALILTAVSFTPRFFPTLTPTAEILASVCLAIWILLAARTAARLTITAVRRQWYRWFPQIPPTTLADFLIILTIYTIALLMVLNQFGLSITPLLTALGVGGLAVALGVQETLANLFAGLSITLARLVRPGDYLRLENGLEGVIHDIGWRYTTLQTPHHTLVIVPNLRMSQLIVTNLSLPEPRTLLSIPITLPLNEPLQSLLARIEHNLIQGADETLAWLADPAPRCRVVGFTDKGAVQLQIDVWLRSPLIQTDALHRLHLHLFQLALPSQN